MKINIINIVGALISSAILMFGCSDDLPTYTELTVNKTEIFIQADGNNPTASISITGGNGNYKVFVADENIATATVEGKTITIKGLKNGETIVTVMDWSKNSATISLRVKEDFDFKLESNSLLMLLNVTPPQAIAIQSGNGGYKVVSSDENVATAVVDADNKVIITSVGEGFATITVTDADGKTAEIKVIVADKQLEIEDVSTWVWKVGETKDIKITSGNPEYTIKENSDASVATAIIDNDDIKVTAVASGETTLTIKDRMGLEKEVVVQVREAMTLETTNIDLFVIDAAPVEIAIIGGSGSYEVTSNAGAIKATLSNDKKKLVLAGVDGQDVAVNKQVVIKDLIFGETQTVTIKEVNYTFEYYGKARYYIGGNLGTQGGTMVDTNNPSSGYNRVRIGEYYKPLFGSAYIRNGFAVTFQGDLEVGAKADAKLHNLNNSGNQTNTVVVTDFEIVKKEGTQYWIRFKEAGKTEYSYIVTWA